MSRKRISDEASARTELGVARTQPSRRERQHTLPFADLSDDEFEILSFLLVRREHPHDDVCYYGKTADGGRDIIHIHNGKTRLIQCKRFTGTVGIPVIRADLAKLCVNVFRERIPDKPDELVFYLVPDVSAQGADLIRNQKLWREVAAAALSEHLGEAPPADLLAFAQEWWPNPSHAMAITLTERLLHFPDLVDEFFAVKKVIDGAIDDVRTIVHAEVQTGVKEVIARLQPDLTPSHGPANLPAEFDDRTLRDQFKHVSLPLLTWPTTLGDNRWIPREESDRLSAVITNNSCSTALLLGPPGSGKSALLARLTQAMGEQGHVILGIKADTLAPDIGSLAELSEYYHLPGRITDCIRHLARSSRVVVFVDQLDALAELTDLRSERLNALLSLIAELHALPNVHVVASCRTFEHAHDVRLTTIDARVETLSLPPWDSVAALLAEQQIDAHRWPEDARELLRTPQHLKVFLQRAQGTAEDRVFSTYQQLLDDLWTRRVLNADGPPGRSDLLNDIAERMAADESIWLPLVRFEGRLPLLTELEAADILVRSSNGLSIGFRHQTLFEHARARAFARGTASLADHVFARQDGLFIRPVLWSCLQYLRGADLAAYERDMERLWKGNVRKHVRHLLIDFLGQASAPPPSPREQSWLSAALTNDELRAKTLAAVRGNNVWFPILAGAHLPAIMRLPEQDAWPVVGVIGSAWADHRGACLDLIRRHWLPNLACDALVWRTLDQCSTWDTDVLDIATQILRRANIVPSAVMHTASGIAETAPEYAIQLVAVKFAADVERCEQEPDPPPPTPSPDEPSENKIAARLLYRPKKRFEDLLRNTEAWYDLPSYAKSHPDVVLNALWPTFVRVVEHLTDPPERYVHRFRADHSLVLHLGGDESGLHMYPLLEAIETAVRGTADKDPPAFLAFLHREQSRDCQTVQRLLCRGLCHLAAQQPQACLKFLTEDERRFSLGSLGDEHEDSKTLIGALAEHLSASQMRELEQAILGLKRYTAAADDREPAIRFQARKWEREHRLQLLMAILEDRLSSETRQHVRSELTSLPQYADAGTVRIQSFGPVESRMSAEVMGKARNEDIIRLFDVVPDSQEHHPKDFRKGGSREAAREFAGFTKMHPQRAIAIISSLKPGLHERPVAYALTALAETDLPSSDLFDFIRSLDERGFRSQEFRVNAAQAATKRAVPDAGLPDALCSLFERWLADRWEPHDSRLLEPEEPTRDHPRSVLWDHDNFISVPYGAYSVLHAVTCGYMNRRPPALDRWLATLEAHVERAENPDAWHLHTIELRHLGHCDRDRSIRFIERLYERFPEVRDSALGAGLITHLWSILPETLVHRWMCQIRDSSWSLGPQTYGELLALRTIVFPEDRSAAAALDDVIRDAKATSERVRTGVAFAAGQLWTDAHYRNRATDVFVRLVPGATGDTAYAVMDAFRLATTIIADAATLQFLQALHENPAVLTATQHTFFVEHLEQLLSIWPDLIVSLCRELVQRRSADLASIQSGLSAGTPQLTNIALTLQRLGGEYRQQGLDLFEQLLDVGIHEAQAALNELDKRLRSSGPVPRPRRRRRGVSG